ncbi:MAG: ATP-binding protein [Steroidobacteraceae bacterium]|jgi:PAS domain S-box-containing protein
MQSIAPDLARSALDAAPDAIIIIDAAGDVKYANRQVSALFGYQHDEVIDRSIETLMPERFRARHVGHREGYADNLRLRPMGTGLELFGRRCDGSEFPLEISLSPVKDGDRTLIAAAIRDVSDRKRVEAELTVARDAAEAMRELADRANQAKSRFLAAASHDLRQPLQTLSLLNGALRRLVTFAQAAEALSQQEQAISAMSRLLNSLLDISKLESGAIQPELVDFTVVAIFDEMRTQFAGLAASKGLQLVVDSCDTAVHSDPSLVEQILRNLVSNAVKYTRQGWVHVRCLREGRAVRIEVHDTGVGIPADQLAYVFDEFYQVERPADSARDGYGLGLSIVQRLVNLLSLKLDVQSDVGKGTKFTLTLPACDRNAAPKQLELPTTTATGVQARGLGGERVLLVEDNVSVQRATTCILELEGYRVTPVSSLSEALRHVQGGNHVDLLVSDYHLGNGETGTHVVTAIRELLGSTLPAVIATGDTSSAIKKIPRDPRLRIASKPIKSDVLLSMLRELLAH